MIPWRLVLRNLLAHPLRALLTLGSMLLATFLIALLHALVATLDAPIQAAAADRLIVQSRVSLFVDLPLRYQTKIEEVEGIEHVSKWQWFGGYYQDTRNRFAQFGVDRETLFDAYPEIEIAEGSKEDFLRQRTATMVGEDLAAKYDWKVGDRINLFGTIFARTDGRPWEFDLAAIYRSRSASLDSQTMFFAYEYLHESIETGGAQGPQGVGVYLLKLAPGVDPTRVMATVDGLFESDEKAVQTTTEAEFVRQFITMFGNIPALLSSIGGGVLFAIILAVLNTMIMAGRERTRDIGVMKALGFTGTSVAAVLIAEALFICLLGAIAGIGFSLVVEPMIAAGLGAMLPGFAITSSTIVLVLIVTVGIGLLAGGIPAWRAARLRPVEALRREG